MFSMFPFISLLAEDPGTERRVGATCLLEARNKTTLDLWDGHSELRAVAQHPSLSSVLPACRKG